MTRRGPSKTTFEFAELRQALRSLTSSAGVSVASTLTLALGVAAATVAATVIRGVLLAPLAYPEADQLVRIYQTLSPLQESSNPRLAAIWNRLPLSYLNATDLQRGSHTLTSLGLYLETDAVLDSGSGAQEILAAHIQAAHIQAELLQTLGVEPLLGRLFTAAEADQGKRLVLLSHSLWRSVFGGDRGLVGKPLHLNGKPHTVVGIMPSGFTLPGRQDQLWTPLTPEGEDLSLRDNYRYAAIGRLMPGATLTAAEDELASAGATMELGDDAGLRLVPLLDTVVGDSRRLVALLAFAAGCVLLVACVNVCHLLLARGVERQRDFAVRLALGASRWRLLGTVCIENLLLALAGGACALALAPAALRGLATLAADELPRIEGLAIDSSAAFDALVASVLAALAAGLLPALRTAAVNPGVTMAVGCRERRSESRSGAQSGLMVAEVALALILTSGATLLAISWQRLATVDLGFEPRGVLVQEIRLPDWLYPDPPRRADFAERLLASLEALPGAHAALTSRLPAAGPVEVWGFRIVGRDPQESDWTQGRIAAMHFATPGYFNLMGIPVLVGRPFMTTGGDAEREVVVNQTLAERHWPEGDVVGAEVIMGELTYRVVGVIGNLRHLGLAEEPGELMVQPWSQRPPAEMAALVSFAAGSPLEQAGSVRSAVHRLDPALPLPPAMSLEQVVASELIGHRSRTLLVGLLTGVALLLTVIGTYAMVAYSVGRRRREIGIRMALGADTGSVRQWILRRILRLALTGVAIGILGTLAAGRLFQRLLFGIEASDPPTLAGTALLLIVTCLVAGYLPARRASRLEPALTLRGD